MSRGSCKKCQQPYYVCISFSCLFCLDSRYQNPYSTLSYVIFSFQCNEMTGPPVLLFYQYNTRLVFLLVLSSSLGKRGVERKPFCFRTIGDTPKRQRSSDVSALRAGFGGVRDCSGALNSAGMGLPIDFPDGTGIPGAFGCFAARKSTPANSRGNPIRLFCLSIF